MLIDKKKCNNKMYALDRQKHTHFDITDIYIYIYIIYVCIKLKICVNISYIPPAGISVKTYRTFV